MLIRLRLRSWYETDHSQRRERVDFSAFLFVGKLGAGVVGLAITPAFLEEHGNQPQGRATRPYKARLLARKGEREENKRMLNFGVRNLLRLEDDGKQPVRPVSAERRLGYGVDHRSRRVQKKSLFGHIFKEDIPLRVLHSQSERTRYYNRFGCWVEPTPPEFLDFFRRWFVLGGKTHPAPIHKVQKRYKVVK